MAKTKTKAPVLKDAPAIDFTFEQVSRSVIRFNAAAVVYIEYDRTTDNVSIIVDNELTGSRKTLSGKVIEEAK